jgi:hypothetical protein
MNANLQILSLLLRDDPDAAAEVLDGDAGRTRAFIEFVSANHLRPYVRGIIEGTRLESAFPSRWLARLDEFSVAQLARKEGLVAELVELREAFAAADVDFILLKGPYLAERFFGGIDNRFFTDLDLFVHEERFDDVERLLATRGYRRRSTTLFGRRLTTPFVHALDFGRQGVMLDLHWSLSAHVSFRVSDADIWSDRREFVLRGVPFAVLSDEYEIVLHALSIFRDLERGIGRMKPFVDVFAVLRGVESSLDWAEFFERRRGERILKITANILAMTLELLACHDLFPTLVAALEREREQMRPDVAGSYAGLLRSSPGALHNKLWTSRVYDCPRAVAGAWWLVSLPFRLAVYRPGKYERLAGNVRRLADTVGADHRAGGRR